jgi:heat shock protein HslJ
VALLDRRIALVALLPLLACGGPAAPTGGLPDGTWVLVDGRSPEGPVPLVETHPVTLTIEDREISGTAACNSYGGTAVIDGQQLTLREVSQTEMACEGPDVMASEAAYLQALLRVREYVRDGERLELSGEEARLVFASFDGGGADADDDGTDDLDPDTPVSDEPLPEPDESSLG